MALISAAAERIDLRTALTIDGGVMSGGFGRSQAVENANEFACLGLLRRPFQACKTSTPGSNPGGASNSPKDFEDRSRRGAAIRASSELIVSLFVGLLLIGRARDGELRDRADLLDAESIRVEQRLGNAINLSLNSRVAQERDGFRLEIE
jgi:hypothetical protein